MTKPKTYYTKSGGINIAYQIIGEGQVDIVYIPGWVSNIDLMWDCPQLARFLFELSKVARVILFDKRGTGLSDRISELSTLEERMDDIRAVMDAVKSERAVLFGHSEGGSVSALFAATYPDRTISLITFGVFAKRRYSVDYPWAPTDEEREKVYDMIRTSWGSSDMYLESLAPSLAHDKSFMDWLATYFRSGASPSAALVLTKMNTQVDIIDILETIKIPTLLMYRTHDIDVKIEEGRFIAERIEGSKLIEFPGNDHLFWAGDAMSVLEEMTKFIKQTNKKNYVNRTLTTILSLSVDHKSIQKALITSNQELEIYNVIYQVVVSKIKPYNGNLTFHNRSSFNIIFDGPSKAINCAIEIKNSLSISDIKIKQGIHIGECVSDENGNISGRALLATEEIMNNTPFNQINTTSTVINLISGTGHEFEYDQHIEIDNNRVIQVFRLIEQEIDQENNVNPVPLQASLGDTVSNPSLLEETIKHIENNMSNEDYSLNDLCDDIGLSPRQLQRKLKTTTNKSPNQIIRLVRLYRAKEILLDGSKSVKEIAYETGFGSFSYFSKAFKKEFGVSPSEIKL